MTREAADATEETGQGEGAPGAMGLEPQRHVWAGELGVRHQQGRCREEGVAAEIDPKFMV